jgi:hypothetical protein
MANVTLTLKEYEDLKHSITKRETRLEELTTKLESLNETRLKHQSIELSKHILNTVFKIAFKQLGFSSDKFTDYFEVKEDYIYHRLGKPWYHAEEKLEIDIKVELSKDIKKALISIGLQEKVLN